VRIAVFIVLLGSRYREERVPPHGRFRKLTVVVRLINDMVRGWFDLRLVNGHIRHDSHPAVLPDHPYVQRGLYICVRVIQALGLLTTRES
jgi:hypothetical protein